MRKIAQFRNSKNQSQSHNHNFLSSNRSYTKKSKSNKWCGSWRCFYSWSFRIVYCQVIRGWKRSHTGFWVILGIIFPEIWKSSRRWFTTVTRANCLFSKSIASNSWTDRSIWKSRRRSVFTKTRFCFIFTQDMRKRNFSSITRCTFLWNSVTLIDNSELRF